MENMELPYTYNENVCDESLWFLIGTIKLIAFDFDGVLTDNTVYVFKDGSESVRCYRGDGIGLDKMKRFNIRTIVISSETDRIVSVRCSKLGIRCIQGCKDKVSALKSILEEKGFSMSQAAFVGNDVNDIECLKIVGLPIVVKDAHPDVVKYAKYQTRLKGGYGAVREICDLFEQILVSQRNSK